LKKVSDPIGQLVDGEITKETIRTGDRLRPDVIGAGHALDGGDKLVGERVEIADHHQNRPLNMR
jgi:hypothetical protein